MRRRARAGAPCAARPPPPPPRPPPPPSARCVARPGLRHAVRGRRRVLCPVRNSWRARRVVGVLRGVLVLVGRCAGGLGAGPNAGEAGGFVRFVHGRSGFF